MNLKAVIKSDFVHNKIIFLVFLFNTNILFCEYAVFLVKYLNIVLF